MNNSQKPRNPHRIADSGVNGSPSLLLIALRRHNGTRRPPFIISLNQREFDEEVKKGEEIAAARIGHLGPVHK